VVTQKQIPIIYNLFPRLVGRMPDWLRHAARAVDMGFNWLYINPILYTGYSGSLYAVKHHYLINPLFLPPGAKKNGLLALELTLKKFRDMGLWPMMDLVINHTSRDCPLVHEHRSWYLCGNHGELVSPFVQDVDDPKKITVWDDLAEIDNEGTVDREGLWLYWAELVKHYLRLGFKGFRCDTAYKVPAALWRHLVDVAAQVDPEAVFFAETLGGIEEKTLALRGVGLHYFFNSSKWWDFDKPWCLEQHKKFGVIAPSISFPESHDTPRLAAATDGNEAVQRQRYAFAAAFSAGLMIPIGYEFGFKRTLDVVCHSPKDWEEPAFDIQQFIRRVNLLKLEHPLLHGEGSLRMERRDENVLVLERRTEQAPGKVGWILVNKRWDKPATVSLEGIAALAPGHCLYRICKDDSPWSGEQLLDKTLMLDPAEVALVLDSAGMSTETGKSGGETAQGEVLNSKSGILNKIRTQIAEFEKVQNLDLEI
jgi:starch synthase (maltosyl-transferring)